MGKARGLDFAFYPGSMRLDAGGRTNLRADVPLKIYYCAVDGLVSRG